MMTYFFERKKTEEDARIVAWFAPILEGTQAISKALWSKAKGGAALDKDEVLLLASTAALHAYVQAAIDAADESAGGASIPGKNIYGIDSLVRSLEHMVVAFDYRDQGNAIAQVAHKAFSVIEAAKDRAVASFRDWREESTTDKRWTPPGPTTEDAAKDRALREALRGTQARFGHA